MVAEIYVYHGSHISLVLAIGANIYLDCLES
jgi:hypothetical protein